MAFDITVPDLGESVVEATVARWLKNPGDAVRVGEAILVLETEKVDLEVGAEKAGVLARIDHPAGDDVKIGEVLGAIDDSAEVAAAAPAPQAESQPPNNGRSETQHAKATPAPASTAAASSASATPVAQRMASAQGVDIASVPPGSGGKVTKTDVQRYLESRAMPPAATAPAAASAGRFPVGDAFGRREERVKMSRRRRTIAARLVEAQQTAAMLTTFNEIDMSAVMAIREKRKATYKEKYGVSLGFSSFFVKAVIGALKANPRLNAEIQGDEMVLKHYYDIGVAIGADEGLVVPVLRDADRMSFAQIEQAIKKYAAQAQNGTLALEDLLGGTFTITNGGVFGSLMSTPILNPPQVGILGLHKIEQRVVVVNGEMAIRPMMYVALSYDHRLVDGREAVTFLVRVKELIEDPETLLVEG
jgi:2-oxoglutarate dehydrogenase E2 component (dihydrolipoamide succinyltransferase)